MRHLKCVLVLGLLAATLPAEGRTTGKTAVRIATRFDRTEVPLNREAVLTVEVYWSGGIGRLEIESIEEPVLTNFDIIGTATANRVEDSAEGRLAVREITYRLKPRTLGMAYVESAVLTYKDRETGSVHRLQTERVGITAVAPVPETAASPLWIWLAVPAVVFVAGFLFYTRLNRARGQKEIVREDKITEEQYLEKLKTEIDPETSERSAAFIHLTQLFRRYLTEKYAISALETTTGELIGIMLDEGLDEALINEAGDMLQKADLIKFSAREAEPAELRDAYTTVESFLEEELARQREERLEAASGKNVSISIPFGKKGGKANRA